jgi:hypothetical protein
MKCCSCDRILTDFEATRKGAMSGEYLDLCNQCIKGLGIATLDRPDLEGSFTSIYEDPDYDDYGTIIPSDQHNGWLYDDSE